MVRTQGRTRPISFWVSALLTAANVAARQWGGAGTGLACVEPSEGKNKGLDWPWGRRRRLEGGASGEQELL